MSLTPVLTKRFGTDQPWKIENYERLDGYAGLRNYHAAMLDINGELISRWDASIGHHAVDVSDDLQKLAMDTVALAGFGARFESFAHDGLAPIPQSFTAAIGALPCAPSGEGDKNMAEEASWSSEPRAPGNTLSPDC